MSVIIEGSLKEVLEAIEAEVPAGNTAVRDRLAYLVTVVEDYPHLAKMQLGVGVIGLQEFAVTEEEE